MNARAKPASPLHPLGEVDFFACTQYSVAEIEAAQRALAPVIHDLRGAHRDRQLASFTINADAVAMLARQMAELASHLRTVAGKKLAGAQQ